MTKVIQEEFGVSYHPGHVSRLLKELHWTPQLPIAQVIQHDEQEIRATARRGLASAQARQRPAASTAPWFSWMNRASTSCLARSGPTHTEGHTPVLHEWQTRDHLSVMGGVTPEGKIYTLMPPEALNGLHTIEFLKHLIRHVGSRLLVIWDGSPIHRRTAVEEFLASDTGRGLRVERLPPYAPDLNPVEGAWQHLEHLGVRDSVCLDVEELHLELHLAVGRLRQKPRVIRSFFVGAGLEAENFSSLRNAL